MSIRKPDLLFDTLYQEAKEFSPIADSRKAAAMMGQCFKHQQDFIEDPARFKSMLCPRRAGKSFAAAVYLVNTCLKKPGAKCVYATLTQKSGRGIIWGLLKQLDLYWELKAAFHNTNVVMTFPSGATIQVAGADSRAEIDKFRGQGYDLFVIDECKSFPYRMMEELVDEVVSPALSDRAGSLVLMGTPGNLLRGPFYDSTRRDSTIARPYGSKEGGNRWSFHRWTTQDNVKMPHLWPDQLAMKQRNGWSDDNPKWRREYLGEWIADDTAFVYKYSEARNGWEPDPESENPWGLPAGHEWQYVLGCDLGYDDPFAIVVSAFSNTHPCMYEVFCFKERHMIVADIARKIDEVTEMFGEFAAVVGDRGGLGKMVFEELAHIYGINIEPAEKTEKRDYIELLNSDIMEGRIRIRPDSQLADEWSALVWKEDTGKGNLPARDQENKSCHNHLADAFLYSWRYSYHHFFRDRVIEPEYGSHEYWQMKSATAMEEAVMRRRRERMSEGEYFNELESTVCDDDAYDDDGQPWGEQIDLM
jgi:hypothetical protein